MTKELQALLAYAETLHQKHLLYESTTPYSYNPGMTENLQQYDGKYYPDTKELTVFTEVKGLRYENRSRHLEHVVVGDAIELRRDADNAYNPNNFELFRNDGKTLGSLPAEFCNLLAPLYDTNVIQISSVKASYIEQFETRSRYAKQGILFVRVKISIKE